MIPLMVDLHERTVVIFGGGTVGARKARYFASEARLKIISRNFGAGISGIPAERITRDLTGITDEELRGYLDGAYIAIATTPDPALNNRIGKLCGEMGILFNNARGEKGDLLIPSVTGGEHYLLAISTGGSSPAVSRYLREYLEKNRPGLDTMVRLQERLRVYLAKNEEDEEMRKTVLWNVLSDEDIWQALSSGDDRAWDLAQERYL
jgi:precorrin-2 dehydrogenase/sirohydrochlorin ferrochelatase